MKRGPESIEATIFLDYYYKLQDIHIEEIVLC